MQLFSIIIIICWRAELTEILEAIDWRDAAGKFLNQDFTIINPGIQNKFGAL